MGAWEIGITCNPYNGLLLLLPLLLGGWGASLIRISWSEPAEVVLVL